MLSKFRIQTITSPSKQKTNDMTLNEIKFCVKNWSQIRQKPTQSSILLNNVSGFFFHINEINENEKCLHAYIGLEENELKCFLLASCDDTEEAFQSDPHIVNKIGIYTLNNDFSESHQLPSDVALSRINNWHLNKERWIIEQSTTKDGVFQAFVIPYDDIQPDNIYIAFFGLKPDTKNPTGFVAELIIQNNSKDSIKFYDTVRPVPPFKPGMTGYNNFYLLKSSVD